MHEFNKLIPSIIDNNQNLEFEKSMMNLALKQAYMAYKIGEVPIGAIIVDQKGVLVSQGYNKTIITHDPSAHAEIVALRAAASRLGNYRLNGLSLYVTIEPCIMCIGAVFNARLSKLIFGAYAPKTGACGTIIDIGLIKKLNHQTKIIKNILPKCCGRIMKKFFYEKRLVKRHYV